MKAVIQRVSAAKVDIAEKTVGRADKGLLILLGVAEGDSAEQAELLARKTANLRIFTDNEDKMNLSLLEVCGDALVISNFTLCADTKKGNRPSFAGAMQPDKANELYEYFCEQLTANGVNRVEKGVFGADMQVSLINEGPVTVVLDTDTWRK